LSGLISFIPGGFGTFDLVVLLGLKSLNVPEEKIVLALLLYRLVYYLFPVLIALILATFEFRDTAKRYWDDSKLMVPIKDMSSLLASYQKDILARIPAFSIAILLTFTSLLFFFNNITIIYDGLYSDYHAIYYITVFIHTCACLLLFFNVLGFFYFFNIYIFLFIIIIKRYMLLLFIQKSLFVFYYFNHYYILCNGLYVSFFNITRLVNNYVHYVSRIL